MEFIVGRNGMTNREYLEELKTKIVNVLVKNVWVVLLVIILGGDCYNARVCIIRGFVDSAFVALRSFVNNHIMCVV